ncbi:MAG: exopolysaccharide biosynthesis protein [Hoeflea sp.]|uniref:exopolysaccharide biosynthesis protein n=1 Tax=Hoeflea sp. TaxID=1940281 RepID=UPI001DAFE0EE|nr:exopolysaccharide biosynthesis protein [Hoeflea sp.]MBU4532015.1 exopolysaccharide biosynthesis protein [Alphaproteobacteria bacterium]MBU4543260.1 exopolysaccharide biosynthesis protein [Alphaproteobacteria bacterium]MBU4549830.1 exopolysaccharide biosynthesis protein [Alphaproteobacteria bacterium]MBV1726391.1 exopolysaccharide biosynthesis protein [Hoeflea sp.]MBV1786246.1 exopolysaccharide biosynthesis protein [Hoeflea sp.]
MISDILADLPHRLSGNVTIGDVIAALGGRAPGIMVAAVSIPAIVPTPGIPAGMVFGAILSILATQMTLGKPRILMPAWIARRTISPHVLESLASHGSKLLRRVERQITPRLTHCTGQKALRWLGPVLVLLGILIALPIPFGNTLPGLGALLIGLGAANRDGYLVIGGTVLGVLGGIVSAGLVYGGWRLVGTAMGYP